MPIFAILTVITAPIFFIAWFTQHQHTQHHRRIEQYGQTKNWHILNITTVGASAVASIPFYNITYQIQNGHVYTTQAMVGKHDLFLNDPTLVNSPQFPAVPNSLQLPATPTRPQWKTELERLNDPDAYERKQAIKELILLGENNELIIDTLEIMAGNDEDPHIRQTASRALTQLPLP